MVESNERSSLWGTSATAALLGGAGYTAYQSYKPISKIIESNTGGRIESAIQAGAAASKFNFSPVIQNAIDQNVEYALSNESKDVSHYVRQYAYQSLMSSNRISHSDAITALSSLEGKSNAGSYLSALNILKANQADSGLLNTQLKAVLSNDNVKNFYSDAVYMNDVLSPRNISNISLGSEAAAPFLDQYSSIMKELGIANTSDIPLGRPKIYNLRDTIGGKEISTPMMSFKFGKNQFYNIPLQDTGYTYAGESLGTRYIARSGFLKNGEAISFQQMQVDALANALSTSSTAEKLEQNIFNVKRAIYDNLSSTESAKAAIWTMPESMLSSGAKARTRTALQEAINYQDLDESEIMSLFNKGYYPYTSPSAAAKGTLMKGNTAEALFGPLGNLVSAEQRPLQFIRDWGVTSRGKGLQGFANSFGKHWDRVDRKIKGISYDALMYGEAGALSREAYSAPQLMTFYAKPAGGNYNIGYKSSALDSLISAEEGVVSNQIGSQLEIERTFQKKIQIGSGLPVDKKLAMALKENQNLSNLDLIGDSLLGLEAGTGKELGLASDHNLSQKIIGAEMTEEGIANVYIKEKRKLTAGEFWKQFSEEDKFMMRLASSEKEMNELLVAAGLKGEEARIIGGQRIEKIMSGKLVGRNKMALANQQIEAMSIFGSNIIDKLPKDELSRDFREGIESFVSNPTKYLMDRNIPIEEDVLQKNLIGISKEWGFTNREMQLTFGMADRGHLKSLVESGDLSLREAANILRAPGVIGLNKGRVGDIASGSWGRGSFEQSGFRLLAEKDFAFAGELIQRTEGISSFAAIDKMQATALGQESFWTKLNREGLSKFSDVDDFLQEEGKFYDLGRSFKNLGGSSALYVPGLNEAQDIIGPSFPKGEAIDSPLMQEIKSFQKAINRGLPEEELESAALKLNQAIGQVAASQSSSRGKILGSSINTVVQGIQKDTWGISKETATSMFNDLIEKSTSDEQKTFLKEQLNDLMQGRTVTGSVWRHPTTGPESLQFMQYKIDKGLKEGVTSAPKRRGMLHIPGRTPKAIDMSEMIGMQGDFDRDQLVIAAMSERDTSRRISKQLVHGQDAKYTQFLFNHYALTDLAKENISKTDTLNMTAVQTGYKKLTTAKSATGQVNVALQKFKMGLQYSAPDQYRDLALVFQHMEQGAIGGKHGVLGSELYQTISEAARIKGEKGTSLLESAMINIFGSNEVNVSGTITNELGEATSRSFSMNTREMSEVAMRSFESVSDDVDVAMRMASMAKGKNIDRATLNNLTEQFFLRKRGGIDIAQGLFSGRAGLGGDFESKTSRLLNKGASKIKEIFSAIGKNKKYLLGGAAAAAGIMLMAPSISGALPAGSPARGLSPDEIGNIPDLSGRGMSIPPNRMNLSPSVYDIGNKPLYHANINTRINDLDSSSFVKDTNSMGGNSNIRTRDDRSILNPRRLAEKIHERF